MKRIMLFIMVIVLCFCTVSCQNLFVDESDTDDSGIETVVDSQDNESDMAEYLEKYSAKYERTFAFNDGNYSREGGKKTYVTYMYSYDLKEEVSKADIVATVHVDAVDCAFVYEKDDDWGFMVFSATITDVYKGNKSIGDKIYIKQDGIPNNTVIPLWKAGDELLLCLGKKDSALLNEYYNEIFEPLNLGIQNLQVVVFNNEKYVVNKCYEEYCKGIESKAVGDELREKIIAELKAYDEILGSNCYEIYDIKIMKKYMEELK